MRRATGLLLLLLGGCSFLPQSSTAPQLFDLGPPPPTSGRPVAVTVAEVKAPAWLDSNDLHYRLGFDQPQQLRSYAQHKLVAPPAALVEERVKEALARGRGEPAVGAACTLRLTIGAFEQRFTAPAKAAAVIALRAEIGQGDDQPPVTRAFTFQRPSAPDAPGAARALATLTDTAIGEVLDWAATRCQPGRTSSRAER